MPSVEDLERYHSVSSFGSTSTCIGTSGMFIVYLYVWESVCILQVITVSTMTASCQDIQRRPKRADLTGTRHRLVHPCLWTFCS